MPTKKELEAQVVKLRKKAGCKGEKGKGRATKKADIEKALKKITKAVKPEIVKRVKRQVAKDMPPKKRGRPRKLLSDLELINKM